MLFASSASNDCECTNTLAHNAADALAKPARGKFGRATALVTALPSTVMASAAAEGLPTTCEERQCTW